MSQVMKGAMSVKNDTALLSREVVGMIDLVSIED